ncbi:TPA: hypothetical protein ACGOR8_002042 [Streptococcus suis]
MVVSKEQMKKFISGQGKYLQSTLCNNTDLDFPQVIGRLLPTQDCIHYTFSFSEEGLRTPVGFQLDVFGEVETGKIWAEVVYLDLMLNSLTLSKFDVLSQTLKDIEYHLNIEFSLINLK